MRRVAVVIAMIAGVSLAAAPAVSAQEDAEVVLRIGLIQPLDTLNVTAGFLVSEYEFWTLQYATLTDKAAEDFSTIPGLAESWEASEDGLTYTYTLREGLAWSDGTPLTAEDVAWTVNTSRDQEWLNHAAVTGNLDAVAVDERTVEITSAVPDPKLPTMDAYILPRHIWEEHAAEGDPSDYDARDGVGSGPFLLEEYVEAEELRLVANDSYWEGRPAIDQVVFRFFSNPDAMVAALEAGEIDAAHDLPPGRVADLREQEGIEVVEGYQGGFDELAINAGAGVGQPHPALLDLEVRKAINHATDKEAIVEDVLFGLGEPATVISPSADPDWMPDVPEDEQFGYDPELANQILDEGGYLDSDGDGVREMPDGSDPIVLRHLINTDSDVAAPIAEFFVGWMEAIGIGVETSAFDSGQLIEEIGRGDYDTFVWGWTPFVDPDPMLSYFTSDLLPYEEDPSDYYNDANWSNERYDELYLAQNQELDPDTRREMVHEMLRIFHDDASYIVLYYNPDLQAYRTDRFDGWVQQPADVGPVIFSNSSPSYRSLEPVGGGDGDGGTNFAMIAGAAGVAVLAALGIGISASRRRKTVDERE